MNVSQRRQISEAIGSRFVILDEDGKEIEVSSPPAQLPILEKFPNLKALVNVELLKGQPGTEPPSIQAMQQLELVDYEPASDKGHFRFYPKGALIFNLLRQWAEEIALGRLDAYPIETPIIYDWDEPDIRSQAESFHENHYVVRLPDKPEKEFILRFAGDFGLFRMMRDAQLTHKHLPVRLYEFAPSFRYEASGSLSGLRRLRGFWMPDIHSFCLDLKQGLDEYKTLFYRYTDLANGMGVNYAVAFRVVEEFYEVHKAELVEMIKYNGAPALIEILSDMKHYWVLKHEVNTVDCNAGICQTSTVQLDIKDAALYGITYVAADGEQKGCTIVHSSIGSIERWVFSILEDALKKDPPVLPLWLAPTQVRIIPISEEKHLGYCLGVAEELKKHRIRVDVDDRNESMNWRIRGAEREWVPYVVVCGDKEQAGAPLSVRIRGAKQEQMSVAELASLISKQTAQMPFSYLSGMLVSKRPVFRGRD